MRSRHRYTPFWMLALAMFFFAWAVSYFKWFAGGHFQEKPVSEPVSVVLPGKEPFAPKPNTFKSLEKFTFQGPASLGLWEEKIFKGKTEYVITGPEGDRFLSATSRAASSGLYRKVRRDVTPEFHVSWEWKASEFPKKGDPKKLADRSQDDFAARVYVIFPGMTFFSSNVIEYIWDENLPEGTVASSPFSERVKLFVVRSGKPLPENEGWRREERNLYEDYTALFEEKPRRPLEAIALMSDSDNTRTFSRAYFRNVELKIKKA